MLHIYTIGSSTSCRRAVQWLKDNMVPFKEHPIDTTAEKTVKARENLSPDVLKQFLAASENGCDELVAPRSLAMQALSKKMDLTQLSLKEMLNVIIDNPKMLRWPIAFDDTRKVLQVGFNDDEFGTFIPRRLRKQELNSILVRLNS
ncbi:Spx/MgsR family RNA polymerase-binding regulatory protein [Furfurilactobacillus sp. WILCCON 0119]|uniref:Spx/MgsR family RNA polymerase-binding regulatory protein n=1 Tax=Furfurilactobacillus entadae TaxID=2922307 RepID=UPI0035E8DA12